jgi:hypothetical protein
MQRMSLWLHMAAHMGVENAGRVQFLLYLKGSILCLCAGYVLYDL